MDWASLAQQWIKMKETTPVVQPGQQIKPAACESNIPASSKTLGGHNVSGPVTGYYRCNSKNVLKCQYVF